MPSWLRDAFDEVFVATADLTAAAQGADPDGIASALERRATCIATLERCVARFRTEMGPDCEAALAREGERVSRAAAVAQQALTRLKEAAREGLETVAIQGAAARGYAQTAVPGSGFERSS